MTYETILLDVRDGVAHLTLNRPDNANGISLELARDLMDATLEIADDSRVRAILLTGAGARFCGGGDVKEFAGYADNLTPHLRAVLARVDGEQQLVFLHQRAVLEMGLQQDAADPRPQFDLLRSANLTDLVGVGDGRTGLDRHDLDFDRGRGRCRRRLAAAGGEGDRDDCRETAQCHGARGKSSLCGDHR